MLCGVDPDLHGHCREVCGCWTKGLAREEDNNQFLYTLVLYSVKFNIVMTPKFDIGTWAFLGFSDIGQVH